MNNIISGLKNAITSYKNEINKIVSDKGALLILVFAVIAYAVIYSIAYKNNVLKEIPIAVVDLDHTQSSRTFSRMINETEKISVDTKCLNLKEAETVFWEGSVKGILLIPSDFERNLMRGELATADLYTDAGYFLLYKETLNAALQVSGTFSAGVEIKHSLAAGSSFNQAIEQQQPLKIEMFNLYNPSGAYGSFVMPGIILLIIQQTLLIGIGMIGGAGREKNKTKAHTELLLNKNVFSVIFGKGLAYFSIGIFNSILCLIWVYDWFDFPDKGSLINIIMLIVPFLFSVIFLGLTISFWFKKREHSILFLVFISPIVLFLSGLSWPESSLPSILFDAAHVFPTTLMIPAFLRIRTMGVDISNVQYELIFLISEMIIYYLLACFSLKYFVKKQTIKENKSIV